MGDVRAVGGGGKGGKAYKPDARETGALYGTGAAPRGITPPPPAVGPPVGAAAGTAAQVKKTPCKFWLQGTCERGDSCTWLHGEPGQSLSPQALRPPAGPWGAPVGTVRATASAQHSPALSPTTDKRIPCKFWPLGVCKRGEMCTFAHQEAGPPVVRFYSPTGAAPPFAEQTPASSGPKLKKTICKFWLQGTCAKGADCTWAHGEGEMQAAIAVDQPRAPPVKRKLCKFWQQGNCLRGDSCTFLHGDEGTPVSPEPEVPPDEYLEEALAALPEGFDEEEVQASLDLTQAIAAPEALEEGEELQAQAEAMDEEEPGAFFDLAELIAAPMPVEKRHAPSFPQPNAKRPRTGVVGMAPR